MNAISSANTTTTIAITTSTSTSTSASLSTFTSTTKTRPTAMYSNTNFLVRKRPSPERESPTFVLGSPLSKKSDCALLDSPSSSTASPKTPRTGTFTSFPLTGLKSSTDRNYPIFQQSIAMDSHNSQLQPPLPAILSVYRPNSSSTSLDALSSDVPQSFNKIPQTESLFSPENTYNPFHQTRHSTSTSASDSAESSPTTSASLDSASVTDSSPGPSPQSPTSMNFAMDSSRFTPLETSPSDFGLQIPTRPSTSSKKPRNLKNLAVNTTAAYNLGRALPTAPIKSDQPKQISAPTSPLFLKPPTPPKRKIGNISLTIVTPATDKVPSLVPPTPGFRRPNALRHFQSSPSLPLLTSSLGPSGGMTLPNEKPPQAPAPRGFAEIPQEIQEEEEDEPNFDIPQSRDEAPETYPNGPIRIYESGVDLYYEPDVEVALRYDVIFNVASEVKNPFDVADAIAQISNASSNNIGVLSGESENPGSPTTPKATPIIPDTSLPVPSIPQKRPEYIHMPWEHNTDIVEDLYKLVKIIDDRVNEGKKVLIHCQCGVSRSASLIIAYGLYKNPDITVQDAYDAVKKRSKWIGPNMSLIMGLQEFRTNVHRKAHPEIFGLSHSSTMPLSSTSDNFNVKIPSAPTTPRLLPNDDGIERLSSNNIGPFSAAPVEKTSNSIWEEAFGDMKTFQMDKNSTSVISELPYVNATGHVMPLTTVIQSEKISETKPFQLASLKAPVSKPIHNVPNAPNFTRPLPFRRDYDQDVQMTDAPSLDSLMSPRSTEFHMTSVSPPPQAESFDAFNLLSPKVTEFAQSTSFLPLRQNASTQQKEILPAPKRAPPNPPLPLPLPQVIAKIEPHMESLDSIFSPKSANFPLSFGQLKPSSSEGLAPPQTAVRNDSLLSAPSPTLLAPPAPKRMLRNKFSAPNLSQCIQLQKMQNDIASKLPKRPAEAEEALMSPRVSNFMSNPFNMASPALSDDSAFGTLEDTERDQNMVGQQATTPKKTIDPRSPPQFGLSPITRNIGDVI